MIRQIKMRYYQFIENWEKDGLLEVCKFSIYRYDEAVPVEMDHSTLGEIKYPEGSSNFELLELNKDNFHSRNLEYLVRSRKEKAIINIEKGYCAFALVKDNQVIADIWCATRSVASTSPIKKYLKWFGIELGPEDCYMFDMHFFPGERGKGMSTFFLRSVLERLKENGIKKSYAYFDAKNIPAVWLHRLLGYKELPRCIIRKFFVYETARAKHHNSTTSLRIGTDSRN